MVGLDGLREARERWETLCREGERRGLKGSALGYYVAQRLTPRELITLAKDHDQHRNTGGSNG